MKRFDDRSHLSEKILGILADRLTGGDEALDASAAGRPDTSPADLLSHLETRYREHIEVCARCRDRLLDEIRYRRVYASALEDARRDSRFDEILPPDEAPVPIDLAFARYETGFHETIALAAASERTTAAIVYRSSDRQSLLRVTVDPVTREAVGALLSDKLERGDRAALSIGDVLYFSTPDGEDVSFDFGAKHPAFTRKTVIRFFALPAAGDQSPK